MNFVEKGIKVKRDREFDMQFCTERPSGRSEKFVFRLCVCTKKLKETIPRRLSTSAFAATIYGRAYIALVTPWGIKNSNPRRVIALVNYTNGQEILELKYILLAETTHGFGKREREREKRDSLPAIRSEFLVHLFSVV